MSTTIKRIALVAVAALSLGVVSTVPSQATVSANSLTLSSTTSTQLTDETSTASAAVATLSFLNQNVGDTVSVTAYLMSAPAGNTVSPVLQVSETTSAIVGKDTAKVTSALAAGYEITNQVAYVTGSADVAAVTAKFKVYMNSASKAGTYVVKLVPAVVGGGGVIDTTGVTLTITVSTNPNTDVVAASATSVLTTTTDTTTTTDAVVTGDKTTSTTEVAYIKNTLKNAAAVTTTGESYTAVIISGPGLLGSGALTNSYTEAQANKGRAITVKAGHTVAIYPSGDSGVSTIQIQSKAGVVLATKTVTFYGDVASITAKAVKAVIAPATSTQSAILVTLKDAAGTNVSKATTFYVTSSDTTKIAGSYSARTSVAYATKNYIGSVNVGAGYLITVDGVAAGTANVTVGTKSSAAATTGVDAAAVAIRVGSTTAASVSVTTDKSSYAPGEKATITVALNDASGLPVADGNYADIFATGGISASYTLGSGSDTTTVTNFSGAWAMADGSYAYTVYLPVTEGDVKFSWTTGTGLATANQGVAGSVTVGVSSVATSAAIDAANEAAQAASDATDAALAAADAADAATTKAQEAVDAVATLSAQVSKLITALKAQITTLTNLVIKIQKKVKA